MDAWYQSSVKTLTSRKDGDRSISRPPQETWDLMADSTGSPLWPWRGGDGMEHAAVSLSYLFNVTLCYHVRTQGDLFSEVLWMKFNNKCFLLSGSNEIQCLTTPQAQQWAPSSWLFFLSGTQSDCVVVFLLFFFFLSMNKCCKDLKNGERKNAHTQKKPPP